MTDEQAYLRDMQHLLHDPTLVKTLTERWAGADPAMTAAALRFYARSARSRRLGFVNHAFTQLLTQLPEEQRDVLRQRFFASHSGRDHDWSRCAEQLLSCIQELVGEGALPERVQARARHLWLLYEAGLHSVAPRPATELAALQVNPTLHLEEFPEDPTAELSEAPRPGTTALGYYLHPETLRGRWLRFEPQVFAAMRIADDGMPFAQAAAEAGLTEQQVAATLQSYVDMGLLVAR